MSSSNTWVTGDVQVNTFSRNSQLNPAVAALDNGNVAIVWASLNQQSSRSMQDIYGQVLSPTGQKIGAEFPVNQFTPFNQRTPAISTLSGGRFLVAWVSEQQRTGSVDNSDPLFQYSITNQPSVDIYARVFEDDGTAPGNEFVVNTGSDICANPAIATGADGSFIIAWSQRDMLVRNNGWDIFARPYSKIGFPGATRAINSRFYGDQFAPQVSVVGADYLVTWSSMGQDGSWEGVYGQLLTGDGSASGPEFLVNTTTAGRQIHPGLASDGNARFLSVWSSYSGGAGDFDLYAQAYASSNFVASGASASYGPPPAEAFDDTLPGSGGPPNLGVPPGGGSTSGGGVLTNGFSSINGYYSGLFYDTTNGVSAANAGSFAATVTARGTYTAKLMFGGRTYSLSGHFSNSGQATGVVMRGNFHSLRVKLQLDVAGGNQLQGQITDGTWVADLMAHRLIFNKSTKAASQAGSYMIDLPGTTQNAGVPAGDGFGTVKVDAGGIVQWAGSLADGTKVSQKSALSAQGIWPLYASLYGGKGCALGWIQVTNGGLSGPFVWLKAAGASSKSYAPGFTNAVEAAGVPFHAPSVGTRILNWTGGSGDLVLSGGGLTGQSTSAFRLELNNKVTNLSNRKLSLTINPSSGLFKGSVINPSTGKPMPFQGAFFEDWNFGLGYFLNPTQSGQVLLAPAQ
jgi:hypothetical protein